MRHSYASGDGPASQPKSKSKQGSIFTVFPLVETKPIVDLCGDTRSRNKFLLRLGLCLPAPKSVHGYPPTAMAQWPNSDELPVLTTRGRQGTNYMPATREKHCGCRPYCLLRGSGERHLAAFINTAAPACLFDRLGTKSHPLLSLSLRLPLVPFPLLLPRQVLNPSHRSHRSHPQPLLSTLPVP